MSYGSYEDMAYFQRMEEAGPEGVEPPALVWTASDMEEQFGPNGPDEDDIAAMNLAMDKNMAERDDYWRNRAYAAESRLRELEEYEPDE